jgi:AcrR family transcriptional regulator
MKTRDRIIQASIELFNEQGERNITTNHIAAHLGISPGNLYYHFRNKEDIILSIYDEYAKKVLQMYDQVDPSEKPLEAILDYMDTRFQLMSRYRFFYQNISVLLAKNEHLHQKYLDVQVPLIEKVKTMLYSLRDAEFIAFEEDDVIDIVSLLRIVITYWLTFHQTQSLEKDVKESAFNEGILKVLSILQPYATKQAKAEFRKAKMEYQKRVAESIAA